MSFPSAPTQQHSTAILLTCVASSAVVVSGGNVCHLRSHLNECWAFHPGFHHLSFGQCHMLHSEWSFTHTHTHTQRLRCWAEKDKKMRDRGRSGGGINDWRMCCPGAHAAVQSTHPSCFISPDELNTLQQCHLVTRYRVSSCIRRPLINLIQTLSMPTNKARDAATGNMW